MLFLSQLINGIQIGSIYALVALGYSMVYGIVKLINFAHGDIIMMGSYAVWFFIARLNLHPAVSIVLSILFCAFLGVAIEKVAYKPLRNSPRISLLITAIGVSFLLQYGMQLIFTPNPRMFSNLFPGQLPIGNFSISNATLVTIGVSICMMVLLTILVNRTKMGKAMRAVSEDNEAAQLMGINVNNTISFTFAIGSALAAVAAVLYCCSYQQIEPTMGSMLGLKAFVAAVLGGIGSIPGAVLGGLLIGIAESFTKGYLSSALADAVVFGILILVLLIKPAGILGRNSHEKV
ncbi:MAG: branched-chain amino acid ABC transporter permease [Clostridiaceae bacterium]|nr:branched-chain amino acid ABC transporter permease [Clostridiaceae bacterium]MDD6273543.1 branched-chain amino acid ABC transporter permease [Clostridiaceae bacterium]